MSHLSKLVRMIELAVNDVSKEHEDHEGDAKAVAAHGTLPLLHRQHTCEGRAIRSKPATSQNW